MIVLLSKQRRATDFVEIAAGKKQKNACTRLKIVRNSSHVNEVSATMHWRACTGARASFTVSVACIRTGVVSTNACAGVYITQVF